MNTSKLRTLAFTLCISLPLLGHSEKILSPAELDLILSNLTRSPLNHRLSTGILKGVLIEESWPMYDYSDHEINAHITNAMSEFKKKAQNRLDLDYLDALPYNLRYAYRASEHRTFQIELQTDQEHYYWELNLEKYEDLDQLKNDLSIPYYLTEQDENYFRTTHPAAHTLKRFNPDWNQQRIYAWDGAEFVFYNKSKSGKINHAWRNPMTESPGVPPLPLRMGFISWGAGSYSYENLKKATISAIETYSLGKPVIHLTISNLTDNSTHTIKVSLTPKRSPEGLPTYMMTSYSMHRGNQCISDIILSEHQWVNNHWMPTCMMSEQPRNSMNVERTERKTIILELSDNVASTHTFRPHLASAFVTYEAPGLHSALQYQMSDTLNNNALLNSKLDILFAQQSPHQVMTATMTPKQVNCATLALDYCSKQLGKPIPPNNLSQIISEKGLTSISDMAQLARKQGLYSNVVKTNLSTLATLTNCQIILHLPDEEHYVVLVDTDTYYAWCLDLAKDHFLYRINRNTFESGFWSEGTALIIAKDPSNLYRHSLQPIPEHKLDAYHGGIGLTCTKLIQHESANDVPCPSSPPCLGVYEDYRMLYECEMAQSGTCTHDILVARMDCPCITEGSSCAKGTQCSVIYYEQACTP